MSKIFFLIEFGSRCQFLWLWPLPLFYAIEIKDTISRHRLIERLERATDIWPAPCNPIGTALRPFVSTKQNGKPSSEPSSNPLTWNKTRRQDVCVSFQDLVQKTWRKGVWLLCLQHREVLSVYEQQAQAQQASLGNIKEPSAAGRQMALHQFFQAQFFIPASEKITVIKLWKLAKPPGPKFIKPPWS